MGTRSPEAPLRTLEAELPEDALRSWSFGTRVNESQTIVKHYPETTYDNLPFRDYYWHVSRDSLQ
jgi:hypothetical protein